MAKEIDEAQVHAPSAKVGIQQVQLGVGTCILGHKLIVHIRRMQEKSLPPGGKKGSFSVERMNVLMPDVDQDSIPTYACHLK